MNTWVGYLITALATVGQQPVVDLLQAIHDKNLKLYRVIIYDADYALSEGQIAATKTVTKIDDELVAAAKGILNASASANGITL